MLYMVGKSVRYGIHFNIVYNESGHKNMNNFECFFFHRIQKKYQSFKTEMEGHETALCCHTHIYLSSRTLQIQIISQHTAQFTIYIRGDNTSFIHQ